MKSRTVSLAWLTALWLSPIAVLAQGNEQPVNSPSGRTTSEPQGDATDGNDLRNDERHARHEFNKSPQEVQRCLDNAAFKLPDAIRTAESATGGKVLCAKMMSWDCAQKDPQAQVQHQVDAGHNLKADSPVAKVVCVTNDKFVEALVCCTTNKVISQKECPMTGARMSDSAHGGGRGRMHGEYAGRWNHAPNRWQRISDLIGKTVIDESNGQPIGEVQELVVEPDLGRLLYFVVEFNSNMNHGNKWFAIPPASAKLSADYKSIVMNYRPEMIKPADGFEKSAFPDMTSEGWSAGVYSSFGEQPYWRGGQAMNAGQASLNNQVNSNNNDNQTASADTRNYFGPPKRWQKASELTGKEVQNDQNEKLGTLKEIVIDPDSGRVLYGVLSYGGVLGIGNKLFAVPWNSFLLTSDSKQFTLAIPKDRLKNAEGFDPGNWPNMADQRWASTTYDYYGQPRYWERTHR